MSRRVDTAPYVIPAQTSRLSLVLRAGLTRMDAPALSEKPDADEPSKRSFAEVLQENILLRRIVKNMQERSRNGRQDLHPKCVACKEQQQQ